MKIYDLSQPLNEQFPFWPYYPPFEVKYIKRKAEHGVNAQYIMTSNHMGTHLDAPIHFSESGETTEVDTSHPAVRDAYSFTYSWPDSCMISLMISSVTERRTKRSCWFGSVAIVIGFVRTVDRHTEILRLITRHCGQLDAEVCEVKAGHFLVALGARRVAPLYGSVDPDVHRPEVLADLALGLPANGEVIHELLA